MLTEIINKINNNQPLSLEDGLKLYKQDIYTLGELASKVREKLHGRKTYFNINRHINPTNICKDVCRFCAYSANRKNPNPYTMTHDEIIKIAENSVKNGAKEVHIVSAHNNEMGLDWYLNAFSKIKKEFPSLHIKALTGAEIHFLATEYNKTYDEIIDLMIQNGVDSMPGGGAEIFNEEVRNYICKGKVSSSQWLEIHEKWHNRGKQSNATMLFGHVETREHRLDHMIRLREVQERTNGFNAFIPLVYQTKNNYLNVKEEITGQEILKTFAISRLMLNNIPHIKSYWVTSTVNLALVAQEFGADDMDGTIEKESINSSAGAKSANGIQLNELIELIKNANFIPVERDSVYNELKIY